MKLIAVLLTVILLSVLTSYAQQKPKLYVRPSVEDSAKAAHVLSNYRAGLKAVLEEKGLDEKDRALKIKALIDERSKRLKTITDRSPRTNVPAEQKNPKH
jgi:hypothetical protein